VLQPSRARTALALSGVLAAGSLGTWWPLETTAYAQEGGEKAGAGGAAGAAGAEKTGAGGGGAESPEKSGAGGAAPAGGEKGGDKQAAAPATETKVVIFVDGPKAAEVKAEIEKSLPAGVTAVDPGPFGEALKKQGVGPLGKSIKGPRERATAAPQVQAAAQEAGVQAAIVAHAPGAKGGKYDIAILIVPSDSPQPLASTNVKVPAKGGEQKRAEAVAGVVSPAISGIVPIVAPAPEQKAEEPKAEEPKAEEPKAEEPKKEDEEKKEEPAQNTFVKGKFLLEAGVGTQGRSFFYIQPLSDDNVRPYDLLAAPHLFARADFYPFAGPGDSFANNIGLTAMAGGSFGIRSTINGQTGVGTTFFHFRAGPKVRLPVGGGDKPTLLTGEITYSRLAFTFDDPNGVAPSFTYQSIRPGVGARVPVGPLHALFEGGFHFVSDSGELTARFPNSTVIGLDLLAGVGISLSEKVEGRVTLNYTRYRGNLKAELDPNADTATPYVASGSVDQFFGIHVGAAIAPLRGPRARAAVAPSGGARAAGAGGVERRPSAGFAAANVAQKREAEVRGHALNVRAIAGEHALAHLDARRVRHRPEDEPHGLLGATARRPGDAGDGERHVDVARPAHPLGHRHGHLGAHRPVRPQHLFAHAEQPALGAVGVGDGVGDEELARRVRREQVPDEPAGA
jgi:hypothetical protein